MNLRSERLRINLKLFLPGLAMMALLAGIGAAVAVQATTQATLTMGDVTVYADFVDGTPGSSTFLEARGRIKIGHKGGPGFIKVDDLGPVATPGNDDNEALIFCLQDSGSTSTDGYECAVRGKIGFVNDTQGEYLVETPIVLVNGTSRAEPMTLLPALVVMARDRTEPALVPIRNQTVNMKFLDRLGIAGFAKEANAERFKDIDYTFDIANKRFEVNGKIRLKVLNQDENPNLEIVLSAIFAENGTFTGGVSNFKAKIAGIVMSLSSIVLRKGEFEAGKVEALKVENADLPSFDPDNNQLVFEMTKLKYISDTWSFGAAAAPIKDWVFGDAFRMINQKVTITKDQANNNYLFGLQSTLSFGSVLTDTKNYTIAASIGVSNVNGIKKPIFKGGLAQLTPKLGPLNMTLKNVFFVGDAAQNFFGIQAGVIDLAWNQSLGGLSAAGVTNLKLGKDKEDGLVFGIGGGTFGLPRIKSSVISATVTGQIAAAAGTTFITMTGDADITVAGNSGVRPTYVMAFARGKNTKDSCTNQPAPCFVKFNSFLSGFGFKIAGFAVQLTNPRGLDDGGFAVDQGVLTLPAGMQLQGSNSAGIGVQGLVVKGNGDVTMQGGQIELPPIKIGDYQLVGLKGGFRKQTAGGYEFFGGAKFPLPGIEPGNGSPGISINAAVRTNTQGNFSGVRVDIVSTLPVGGVPMGTTGLKLTAIGGSFDLNNGTATIGIQATVATVLGLPAPINLPLAKIQGGLAVQINPFHAQATADFFVLVFKVASASVAMGHNEGFSGGPGLFVQATVTTPIFQGQGKFRLGKVGTAANAPTRVSFSATVNVGMKRGQFKDSVVRIPPFDINLGNVAVAGGRFKDKRPNPDIEKAGALATVNVIGFEATAFVDFSKQAGSGDFISLVNASDLELIDSVLLRARAAQGLMGYSSRMMPLDSIEQAGHAPNSDLGLKKEALQETLPIVVTQTTTLVAGVGYANSAGAPTIRLQLPGGAILTEGISNTTQHFTAQPNVTETEKLFIINDTAPGTYQLIIDNAPAVYSANYYFLNQSPRGAINAITCGLGSAASGVSYTCNGASQAGSALKVDWAAQDSDSPDAQVSIGYAPVPTDGRPIAYSDVKILAFDLPLSANTYQIDLKEVPTGKYKPVVILDDGVHASVLLVGNTEVNVTDQRAPIAPTGLSADSQPGELLVKWDQNPESDLAGYEIGFGVVQPGQPDDPSRFVYSRNMGPKVLQSETADAEGKLWGLEDNQEIFYAIRAYDISGNSSPWVMQRGKPWALSPSGWTPAPNASGDGSSIDIAFDSPLVGNSIQNGIVLLDANNQPVAGSSQFLFNLDGDKIVGLRFTPSVSLNNKASYTAKLKSGVQAVDGRTMPEEYAWTFTVERTNTVMLPVIMK